MLGIQYPIILGGLHWLGMAELAAAVSEAGGFGLITAGSFNSKGELLEEIAKVRRMTEKPFGINITLGSRRKMDEFFAGAIEARVKAVFTSGHNPEAFVPDLKAAGIKVAHVVPGIKYAEKAERFGADAVVIVGFEAGGHPGMDDVTLMAMIPKASRVLKIPVIAAGAIVDGRGFAAALAMGAEGVQMGTRFVATSECIAHPAVKEAILSAQETDTVLTLRSIKAAFRVLRTPISERLIALEKGSASIEEILKIGGGESSFKVLRDGKTDEGLVSVGQGTGSINEILSADDVVRRTIEEAKEIWSRVGQMF